MPTTTEQFWLTIVAMVISPFLAVFVQRRLDDLRDRRRRRERVFHTLMSTRATRLSPEHVVALNQIDIEWYGDRAGSDGDVLTAWKTYLDHLSQSGVDTPQKLEVWGAKGEDLFVDLLYAMTQSLGYTFDRVHLKRSVYAPVGHNALELEQQTIRRGLAAWLGGQRAVRVEFSPASPPGAAKPQ